MENKRITDVLNASLFGYGYHKIILDGIGQPVDYLFLDVNKVFETITGLKKKDIVNRRVSEVFPDFSEDDFDWISIYGEIALNGGQKEFDQYSKTLDKWFNVFVISPEKLYFTTIFRETTHETLLARAVGELKNCTAETIDFNRIAETMRRISGAAYTALNVMDPESGDFRTVSLAGSSRQVSKAMHILDLDIKTRKWKRDATKEKKISHAKTTTLSRLGELTGNIFPPLVVDVLEKMFQLGPVSIIKTENNGLRTGDFTLMFKKGTILQNRALCESFADIAGAAINRTETEAAFQKENEMFASMMDNVPGIFFRADCDRERTMVFMKAGMDSLSGYPVSDFIDNRVRSFTSVIHPGDRERILAKTTEAVEAGRDWEVSYRICNEVGTLRYVLEKGRAIYDKNGKPVYLDGLIIDISERRQMELELRKNEEKYRSVTEEMPAYFCTMLPDGTYTFVNSRLADFMRLKQQELIGKKLYDFMPEDEAEKIKKEFKALTPEKPFRTKMAEHFSDEGTPIYVRWFDTAYFNDDGSMSYIQGFGLEVTEMKINKLKVEASTHQLQQVMDQVPNYIFVKDIDGTFLMANKAVADVFGCARSEIAGKTDLDYGATEEEMETYTLADRAVIESGKELFIPEERIMRKDGTRGWFQTVKVPFSFPGHSKPTILGVSVDITEGKESKDKINQAYKFQKTVAEISASFVKVSQQNYDKLVDDMLAKIGMFFNVDRSYLFLFTEDLSAMNNTHEWCAIGVTPMRPGNQDRPTDSLPWWKSRILKRKAVIIPVVAGLPEEASVEKQIFESQDIKSLVSVPVASDDQIFGFIGLDAVKAHYSWTGHETEKLGIIANILADSLLKLKYEDALFHAKQRSEEASKAKGQFLANMSHEIRTPLNGVIGFVELLGKTPLSPVQKQYVENAAGSGNTLMKIINDILDFSKIEAGVVKLKPEKTDLPQLVAHCVDIIAFGAAEKSIELLVNQDPHLPRYAVVDPVRLKQILTNLLGNAVKFTDRGEVEIRTELEKLENGKGHIRFSVRDTGIGISKSQQDKLFKAFSQADSSDTRKYGGTGLGLMISELIAQKMGSTIQLESEPDKGSVFSFSVLAEVEEEEKTGLPASVSTSRCLVIDDNPSARQIMKQMLQTWGLECMTCSSGREGLEIMESSGPFDVAFIDFDMPGMDGLETIRLMRMKKHIPLENLSVFLLHSLFEVDRVIEESANLGIAARIPKPVAPHELFHVLRKHAGPSEDVQALTEGIDTATDGRPDELALSALHILVAEDNHMNRELAKSIIERLMPHAVVSEAHNGREAIEMFQELRPDLIFMDVQMPNMDGVEATMRIREIEKSRNAAHRTRISALTASVNPEEKEKCLDAGMDDFLSKPVSMADMEEVLRSCLRNAKQTQTVHGNIDYAKTDHSKTAHGNTAHGNTAHANTAHAKTAHGNTAHGNTVYAKTAHANTTKKNAMTPNKQKSEDPVHFNEEELMERLGYEKEDVDQILSVVRERYPEIIASLKEAVSASDMPRVKSLAHQLKGSSLNMSFNKLGDMAKEMETCATEGRTEIVRKLFSGIEKEWDRVLSVLDRRSIG